MRILELHMLAKYHHLCVCFFKDLFAIESQILVINFLLSIWTEAFLAKSHSIWFEKQKDNHLTVYVVRFFVMKIVYFYSFLLEM